jgi:phage terminase large subunit GpA-like protein
MTTAFENVAAYWAFANPTDQIYSTATQELAKQWATETFLQNIVSMGFQDRLIVQLSNAKNKRAAATAKRIEYLGGHIDVVSSNSMQARRALNARIVYVDELDGIKEMTSTGEGSYIEIIRGHSLSWGAKRKFIVFSSPTTYEASAIWKYYCEGDQRKFLIPCPVCGRHIELKGDDENTNYGLKADTRAGKIIDVYYLCEYCGDIFHNKDKSIFYSDRPHCKKDPKKRLEPAHWEPTRKTKDLYTRSYSINSLYSMLGALTFRDVYEAKIKAQAEGPDAMRSYVNIYMGQPFKDTGQRPKVDRVIELRGEYKSGEVPKDVVFLVMSVDVQRGSEKDEANPPRLELEIMGVCPGRISYSILYKRIEGPTDDPYSGAWEKLRQWELEGGLSFTRTDGVELSVQLMGIDSGYLPDVVYRFCETQRHTLPVKGSGLLRANEKRKEKGDIPGGMKRYRAAKIGSSDIRLLEVNTNYYKDHIYNRLKIERQPGEIQKFGYCGFPRDYNDEYFLMLTGEEKRVDGSFHPIRERVEALDCRVYNEALADFFLEMQVMAWKQWYQQRKGWSLIRLKEIDTLFVLDKIRQSPANVFTDIY